jgi:1-acyl-sn-glycerol-3-phosphate acyltransferase
MRNLRAAGRLLALAGLTGVLYAVYLATRVTRLASRRLGLRTQAACFRTWARGTARILGMRRVVSGSAPPAPFFLAANHLGYVDVILLAASAPVFFVAKAEVAPWPVVGWLARSMSTIFVRRGRHTDLPRVVRAMERVAAIGHGVAFFPEGTSSDGSTVLAFRPPLFEAPVAAGFPVFCASLSYATPSGEPSARTSVCWWGDMTFLDHFWGLLRLSGFEARLSFGERPLRAADRKALATNAWQDVREAFVPVPGRSEPK